MFAIVTEKENFPTSKIAVDIAKPKVPFKSFALEHIRKIEEGEKFVPNKGSYQDAFGMFTDEPAERLVLEFDHCDNHYLICLLYTSPSPRD